MKLKIMMAVTVFFMGMFAAGCGGEKDTVYLETAENETEDTETVSVNVTEESDDTEDTEERPAAQTCYVYVCGAVEQPGVYLLPENSRVYEAVAMAGGLTKEAGVDAVNQAEPIADGQMIRIPTQEEVLTGALESNLQAEGETDADGEAVSDGKIDLNTATAADLMTLPGIGQAKADAIIAYRTKIGSFTSAEEIMKIEGIKEGVYNRIKEDIKVK